MLLKKCGINFTPLRYLSAKFLPETIKGQMLRGQIKMDPPVAAAINEQIMSKHIPTNNLRRVAQHLYQKLNANEAYPAVKTDLETDAYIGAFLLRDYGATYQVLHELMRRIGPASVPQSILDVTHGPSTGMLVLNALLQSRDKGDMGVWGKLRKDSVVLGGAEMMKRASLLLSQQSQEQIQPTRITSNVPSSTNYDLIILNHQLLTDPTKFPHDIDSQMKHYLNMLSPQGHIVILERGTPTGAETLARARDIVLRENEMKDSCLSIIAPCAHMNKDPLQVHNLSYYKQKSNNLKFISFAKMIQRPEYSLHLKRGKLLSLSWSLDPTRDRRQFLNLRGKGRPSGTDHEMINYTYMIIGKSIPTRDDDMGKWPRIIAPPIKKKGHIIFTVCTVPEGQIENWVVTKSMSREIYHDARKARWGDLWPHGAKVKTPIRQKINLKELQAIEKERITKLQREKRILEKEMRQRLNVLDGTFKELTQESIEENAAVYSHYYKKNNL